MQVTSQELAQVLTLLSKAPTTVGECHAVGNIIDRLVGMVNQGQPIASLPAPTAEESPEALGKRLGV